MKDDELVEAWRALAERSRRRRDAEAEDHVQDAVLAALDARRRTGRAPEAARAWLSTVARRREVDTIRRAQCERRVVAEAPAFAEPAADDVLDDVLDRHEARWLAGEVDRLPETTRQVVRALASGRTQADVARQLALTPRAVEAHVRRARLALRRALERAGAVVAIACAGRWWRRATAVTAVGVAAAVVGLGLVGDGTVDRLVPVPGPPRVTDPDEPRAVARPTLVSAAASSVAPPRPAARPVAAAAARPRLAGDPDEDPPPPPPPPPPPTDDPAPPVVDVAGPGALFVRATGEEAPSPLPTVEGAWYEITVAGTYSYNGRVTGLADCGGFEAEGGAGWIRYDAVAVDGTPSPCRTLPRSALHTYSWRQRGTGRPMRFRVLDLGTKGDNLGGLVVTITPVVAPPEEAAGLAPLARW